MPVIFSVGLDGVSRNTARVFGRRAASSLSRSVASTKVVSMPIRPRIVVSSRYVPPYTSSEQMTWSPWDSSMKAVEIAAIPEEKAKPRAPPSSWAMVSSSA